jgi:hypothetical protein
VISNSRLVCVALHYILFSRRCTFLHVLEILLGVCIEIKCIQIAHLTSHGKITVSMYGIIGGMVWYGMVWYGMVWYGMVWYGMVRYLIKVIPGLGQPSRLSGNNALHEREEGAKPCSHITMIP